MKSGRSLAVIALTLIITFGWTYRVEAVDYCLSFNGQDSKVIVPDSASLSQVSVNKNITIDIWFEIASLPSHPPANENPIIAKWGSGSDPDDEWQLYIMTATGKLVWTVNSSKTQGSPNTELISSSAPSFGAWHHVVATWDGNAGQAALYLDDVLEVETNSAITTMPDTSQELTIGYGHFGSTSYGYFDGVIDDPKVLSGGSVLAYWNFDEGEGSTALDSSGNGNHGTIYNAHMSANQN